MDISALTFTSHFKTKGRRPQNPYKENHATVYLWLGFGMLYKLWQLLCLVNILCKYLCIKPYCLPPTDSRSATGQMQLLHGHCGKSRCHCVYLVTPCKQPLFIYMRTIPYTCALIRYVLLFLHVSSNNLVLPEHKLRYF